MFLEIVYKSIFNQTPEPIFMITITCTIRELT